MLTDLRASHSLEDTTVAQPLVTPAVSWPTRNAGPSATQTQLRDSTCQISLLQYDWSTTWSLRPTQRAKMAKLSEPEG